VQFQEVNLLKLNSFTSRIYHFTNYNATGHSTITRDGAYRFLVNRTVFNSNQVPGSVCFRGLTIVHNLLHRPLHKPSSNGTPLAV